MDGTDKKFLEAKARGYRFGVRPHLTDKAADLDLPDDVIGLHHLSEVFDVPYIKKWSEDIRTICVGIVGGRPPEHLVMAFLDDGNKWVVAHLADLTEYEPAEPE